MSREELEKVLTEAGLKNPCESAAALDDDELEWSDLETSSRQLTLVLCVHA